MFKNDWFALLEKVKAGATLYISLDDAYLNTFNEPIGVELLTNIKRKGSVKFRSALFNDRLVFTTIAERKLSINPMQAKVLAQEADGDPIFIEIGLWQGQNISANVSTGIELNEYYRSFRQRPASVRYNSPAYRTGIYQSKSVAANQRIYWYNRAQH